MINLGRNSLPQMLTLTAALLLVACNNKKVAKVAEPATPPPPAPTATLSAAPDSIQQGQSTVLTWQTTNATEITIEGVGAVQSAGSRSVTPSSSQTYTLIAKGAGGASQASAHITVNPVAAKVITPPQLGDGDLFAKNVNDVFFDFDDSRIRSNQSVVVEKDGSFLDRHSNINVLIEGHCDDRGSAIYNLALGERRASTVREALIKQGISPSRIKTVSYGKEKPFCTQEDETCWQQNRRDHFVIQR